LSWRDAPLYVEAHDLARWIFERSNSWPAGNSFIPAICNASIDLVTSISLALTFVEGRVSYLRQADEAIVRLRSLLRLAKDLALLSSAANRFAAGRLQVIGRMVGGWLKRLESERSSTQGKGPPPRGA
jgi:hypothetical protein